MNNENKLYLAEAAPEASHCVYTGCDITACLFLIGLLRYAAFSVNKIIMVSNAFVMYFVMSRPV